MESFGGPDLFNQPFGVSVFDETVYVADTGNNTIAGDHYSFHDITGMLIRIAAAIC